MTMANVDYNIIFKANSYIEVRYYVPTKYFGSAMPSDLGPWSASQKSVLKQQTNYPLGFLHIFLEPPVESQSKRRKTGQSGHRVSANEPVFNRLLNLSL